MSGPARSPASRALSSPEVTEIHLGCYSTRIKGGPAGHDSAPPPSHLLHPKAARKCKPCVGHTGLPGARSRNCQRASIIGSEPGVGRGHHTGCTGHVTQGAPCVPRSQAWEVGLAISTGAGETPLGSETEAAPISSEDLLSGPCLSPVHGARLTWPHLAVMPQFQFWGT